MTIWWHNATLDSHSDSVHSSPVDLISSNQQLNMSWRTFQLTTVNGKGNCPFFVLNIFIWLNYKWTRNTSLFQRNGNDCSSPTIHNSMMFYLHLQALLCFPISSLDGKCWCNIAWDASSDLSAHFKWFVGRRGGSSNAPLEPVINWLLAMTTVPYPHPETSFQTSPCEMF